MPRKRKKENEEFASKSNSEVIAPSSKTKIEKKPAKKEPIKKPHLDQQKENLISDKPTSSTQNKKVTTNKKIKTRKNETKSTSVPEKSGTEDKIFKASEDVTFQTEKLETKTRSKVRKSKSTTREAKQTDKELISETETPRRTRKTKPNAKSTEKPKSPSYEPTIVVEKSEIKQPKEELDKKRKIRPKKEKTIKAQEEPIAEGNVQVEAETQNNTLSTNKVKVAPAKPQVRYSDEDLEIFRKRILEVKNEALEELSMLRERLEDLNSYDLAEEGSIYSMHMAEQGSEIAEKEKVYAQIQRINEYIKKLDEALKRIEDKTYGICRVCGILIAKERLLAVPITTLSASYKIHKKCPEDGIDRIEPVAK